MTFDASAGSPALLEKSNLFAAICNNATVSFFIMDENQNCVYLNPAAEKLTGFTIDELRGRRLHDVIHHTRPDGRPYPRTECPIDQAFPQNNQEQGEEVFVHKLGHFYSVAFTASPIHDSSGQTIGTVIEVQDITEKKRVDEVKRVTQAALEAQVYEIKKSKEALAESNETLETLNRLGAVVSAELDLDRLVQHVTDTATKLCGAHFGALFYNVTNSSGEAYTLYTISGVPREAFSKFPMPRNTQVFAPTFAGQGIVRSDDITKDPRYGHNRPHKGMPDGHLPVVSYLAVPVTSRSGEVIGGLFFGHSKPAVFTERHEELLAGVAAQAAIAIDNARLYKGAQEAIRARDEFLSIASHELKTPLTSLKLQAQLHRRSISKGDAKAYSPENVDSIINQTEKQAGRLTRLVDDMLDVSRIRSGKLKIEPERTDIADIAREVINRLRNQFAQASYDVPSLTTAGETVGNWDRLRIEQVVTNLLTNAIRYGNKKPIEVSVDGTGELVRLFVKDLGLGIAESARTKIFDRFERAIDASEVSGLGLGLFITKQIVAAHGGRIWVESELGQGSTFKVELPRRLNSESEGEVSHAM